MTVAQSVFRNALIDADLAVPEGLKDGRGAPAGARFAVYRNNVVLSLTEALATGFPLVHKLLGGQTFDRLAGVFVRAHPPRSPLMMHYGAALPDFLDTFAPLAHIGYLSDCARLDLAIRRSYHAADAEPLDPIRLQQDPAAVMKLHIVPAPATQVLCSKWPLFDIWHFNMTPDAPKPEAVPQDVMVTRPDFDPQPHLLPSGAALWLDALTSGQSLGAASERAAATHPTFDLASALTLTLSTAALTENTTKDI